jgi:polar amino acid transport system substrate-binding protein
MTPKRNMNVAFAGPYFLSAKAILGKAETLVGISAVADLDPKKLRVVALEGSTSQALVEAAAPNATQIWTKTQGEGVKMIVEGTADVMIADHPVAAYAALRHPAAGLIYVSSPFSYEPIGIAVSSKDTLFVNLIENYLSSLEHTELLPRLRAKWFEDSSWLSVMP